MGAGSWEIVGQFSVQTSCGTACPGSQVRLHVVSWKPGLGFAGMEMPWRCDLFEDAETTGESAGATRAYADFRTLPAGNWISLPRASGGIQRLSGS